MKKLVSWLAIAAIGVGVSVAIATTPAGAYNLNYNCSYDGLGSTCNEAWRNGTAVQGDYAIDYSHNGTCAEINYKVNGFNQWVVSCAGSGGYQTSVCYALFNGYVGESYNGISFPATNDNLAGTIYSYCPL